MHLQYLAKVHLQMFVHTYLPIAIHFYMRLDNINCFRQSTLIIMSVCQKKWPDKLLSSYFIIRLRMWSMQ